MKNISLLAMMPFICLLAQYPIKRKTIERCSCEPYFDSSYQMVLYKNPTKIAAFPGGDNKLLEYLTDSISVPEQDEYLGKISIEFIVTDRGEILYPRAFKRSTIEIQGAESGILRPLRNMPRWQPAMCDSMCIPSHYTTIFCRCKKLS